jgi:hypothetical protein
MDDIRRPGRSKLNVTAKKTDLSTDLSQNINKDDKEPAFVPPEVLADEEIVAASSEETTTELEQPELPKKETGKRKFNFALHLPKGKKQWAIATLVLIVLFSGSASAYWFGIRKPAKPAVSTVAPVVKRPVAPKPTTEASKLSGLQVPFGVNESPVTAVQIENSPDSRPQSGLKDASIIFEAIAEGGITRFNAIYQDAAPDYIGPIRSLRPYYIDWFWPFDASIAHVGGAPQALADIKSLGIKDLDQFYNGNTYDRITSRYAPHNVYTSVARLNELEKAKGFTSSKYTGFTRKKEAKAAVPTAKTVDLTISSYFYNAHYDYNAANNSYLRSEGGEIHKDFKSGAQLEPKVVVAIVMQRGTDGDGEHTDYTTTGSGHMFVFQDGVVSEGTWAKASRQGQWSFTGADGKILAFNPGQTWITMVDSTTSVTYAP